MDLEQPSRGRSPLLFTPFIHCLHVNQILYFITPPRGWNEYKSKTVGLKVDANGQVMMERWPEEGQTARPLRNLPALPDQVCSLLST